MVFLQPRHGCLRTPVNHVPGPNNDPGHDGWGRVNDNGSWYKTDDPTESFKTVSSRHDCKSQSFRRLANAWRRRCPPPPVSSPPANRLPSRRPEPCTKPPNSPTPWSCCPTTATGWSAESAPRPARSENPTPPGRTALAPTPTRGGSRSPRLSVARAAPAPPNTLS